MRHPRTQNRDTEQRFACPRRTRRHGGTEAGGSRGTVRIRTSADRPLAPTKGAAVRGTALHRHPRRSLPLRRFCTRSCPAPLRASVPPRSPWMSAATARTALRWSLCLSSRRRVLKGHQLRDPGLRQVEHCGGRSGEASKGSSGTSGHSRDTEQRFACPRRTRRHGGTEAGGSRGTVRIRTSADRPLAPTKGAAVRGTALHRHPRRSLPPRRFCTRSCPAPLRASVPPRSPWMSAATARTTLRWSLCLSSRRRILEGHQLGDPGLRQVEHGGGRSGEASKGSSGTSGHSRDTEQRFACPRRTRRHGGTEAGGSRGTVRIRTSADRPLAPMKGVAVRGTTLHRNPRR